MKESASTKDITTSTLGTKRYAAVGTGSRVSMYIDPLAHEYKNDGEFDNGSQVTETDSSPGEEYL